MNVTHENRGKNKSSNSGYELEQLHTAKVISDMAGNLLEPTNLSSLARKHNSHTTHLQNKQCLCNYAEKVMSPGYLPFLIALALALLL